MMKLLVRFSALALIIATIFLGLLPLLIASPVWAAPGLSVDGVLLNVTLSPGQEYTHTMIITSGADYPMDMLVEARGFGQALDGSTIALIPQDDNSPYTARPFISSIDNTSFHLEPGSSQQVKATINVPTNTAPGIRYAIIYISSQPGGKSGIGVVIAANVLVLIRIPGSEPVKSGEITNLDVPKAESGKPIQILTTFKNTGTIHFKIKNNVTITDGTGKIISQTEIPLSSSSVIPVFSRLITATFSPTDLTNNLPLGRYFVESGIFLDDGTLLDTKKMSFDYIEAEGGQVAQLESTGPGTSESISTKAALPTSILGHPARGINWSLVAIIITSVVAAGAIIIALVMNRPRKPMTKNKDLAE